MGGGGGEAGEHGIAAEWVRPLGSDHRAQVGAGEWPSAQGPSPGAQQLRFRRNIADDGDSPGPPRRVHQRRVEGHLGRQVRACVRACARGVLRLLYTWYSAWRYVRVLIGYSGVFVMQIHSALFGR